MESLAILARQTWTILGRFGPCTVQPLGAVRNDEICKKLRNDLPLNYQFGLGTWVKTGRVKDEMLGPCLVKKFGVHSFGFLKEKRLEISDLFLR